MSGDFIYYSSNCIAKYTQRQTKNGQSVKYEVKYTTLDELILQYLKVNILKDKCLQKALLRADNVDL